MSCKVSAFLDWFLGRDSETAGQVEERALEVTDIAVAFDTAQSLAATGTSTVLPAVYRAAQFIADTTASLHLDQFDEQTQLVDPIRPQILSRPNPAETYHETISKIVYSLIFRGNAYLWPRTRSQTGQVTSVMVLHPDEVNVQWDRNNLFPVYSWRDRTMTRDKDIIHIPLNPIGGGGIVGPYGVGPIEACRLMLAAAEAEQNLHRTLMADNMTPTGLIVVDGKTQTEVDEIQSRIDAKAAEGKRIPKVVSNARWEQLTLNPVDAQFLEIRNFTIQDIARLFGLQGFFLNVASGDSLTYSTTESIFRLFITGTLRPTYLERIEQALGLLLPRGKLARFNTDELLRADIKARYESYEIGLRNRWLTPNEIRKLEGLPPIPGGDEIASTPPPGTPSPQPSPQGAAA